ncbi:MAG: preprotein translocase subunit SecE [Saprospiraceae bacterium]
MEQIQLYIKESYNELMHKVSWPSWQELQSSTILVIVATLLLSVVLLVMDFFSKGITDLIYGIS